MGIFDKLFKPNIEKIKKNKDVDGLINALTHKNDNVREKAVKALGGIGEPAVEPLIQAMGIYTSVNEALEKEEDYLYGANKKAKEAFIEIWGGSAVEQFIQVLKDIDSGVREQVAISLGEIGDARAVTPLITALIGETTNKYFCYLCRKELKGKDWEFVKKKREKDSESFISDVYRPWVPSKIRNVWKLKNEIFYRKDCISKSDKWGEENKVYINCSFL